MTHIISMDNYDEMNKGLNDAIKKAADKSDSKILQEVSDEIDREDDADVEMRCRILRRIVDKGLEEYGDVS